jgi:hypothetical protein
MTRIDDVPRADREPDGPVEPRSVTFQSPRRVRRRGFLAVMAAGAMTLGVTALSWVPLARTARAEAGTEYPGCGRYGDGPGGPVCYGFPYSSDHCGDDDWFRNGCYENSDGTVDCYRPLAICEAGDDGGRNAWRWEDDDTVWRCADGELQYEGAPNPETVICNARLGSWPFTEPSPTTTSSPTPTPTPTREPEPPLPVPALPSLPALPPLGS